MNWYKTAYELETLTDRNKINVRIADFKQLVGILRYLVKYVFQNAAHAKKIVTIIANNKKISSFPELRERLLYAASRALDNYKDFSDICAEVADRMFKEIKKMQEERKDFTENIYPKTVKERFDGKE